MTMTETSKPKRGGFTAEMRAKAAATRAANKAKAAKPPAPKAEKPDEFAGLTAATCCDACTEKGCVISGKFYCAHPRKGGLQSPQMNDRAAIARLNLAKELLSKK